MLLRLLGRQGVCRLRSSTVMLCPGQKGSSLMEREKCSRGVGVGRCGWQGAGRSKAGGTAAAGHLAAQTAKAGSGKFLLLLELKPYLECENVPFLLKLLLVMGVQL